MRRLPSLERDIRAYSIKAWYTVPRARGNHGVDPNDPREPGYFGPQIRLAARVADELLGGHPANLGRCDCAPCACAFPVGAYVPCWHDQTCPHDGRGEDTPISARLFRLIADRPAMRRAFKKGEDAVYELAGLTMAEREVAAYQYNGVSRSAIARITNRADGTVNALLRRVHKKLRALARDLEEAAA